MYSQSPLRRRVSRGASVSSFDSGMSSASGCSSRNSGDYQVLHRSLNQQRQSVKRARSDLANTLQLIGEHHVRNREYDDAMDAFAEALHEKRSAYSYVNPPQSQCDDGDSVMGVIDGSGDGGGGGGGGALPPYSSYGGGITALHTTLEAQSTTAAATAAASAATTQEGQTRELDEIVATLSNIGNVHSLRGEHSEAMRYYTEVMSLRSAKSNLSSSRDGTSCSGSTSTRSMWSEEDSSTIMTELNEDVRALDDLFRTISFRNGETAPGAQGKTRPNGRDDDDHIFSHDPNTMELEPTTHTGHAATDGRRPSSSSSRKKSSKSLDHNHALVVSLSNEVRRLPPPAPRMDEQRMDINTVDSTRQHHSHQLMHGAQYSPSSPTSGKVVDSNIRSNEVTEALDMFRTVLDTYTGQSLEMHEQEYLNYLNKMSILRQRNLETQSSSTTSSSSSLIRRQRKTGDRDKFSENDDPKRSVREEELNLAMDVYNHILLAQREVAAHPPSSSQSAQAAAKASRQASATVASTLITIGSLHYKLGNVDDELRMYNEALLVYTRALGENHAYVAGTRKNIGMVLAERCEFDAAMDQFDKARAIYVRCNDGDERCRDVASALSCMGNVQNRRGELDGALNLYGQALHIYRSVEEEEEARGVAGSAEAEVAVQDVTSTLKIIGMVHAKRGELDHAMDCFQEALDLLRASTENGSTARGRSGIASILTRIGGILYKKGQYDEAMDRYREAYDLTTEAMGTTNHPDIAGILHYMGGIHHKRAKYVDAMECYKETVKIYHATLGPDNPAVATTLVCIGSIHYKKKNLENAMIFYREALRLYQGSYGPHHPDVAPTLKSIGMIHTKRGEYDEAMEVFQEVLKLKCAMLGTGHPGVANAYKSLGNVYFKRGELADAEREYRHALSIYKRTVGEGHPDTISARKSIDHIKESIERRKREGLTNQNEPTLSGGNNHHYHGEHIRIESRSSRSSSRSRGEQR